MGTDLTPRDDALLKAAADGLSGQEIEEQLGIPAAKAVVRIKELLKQNDFWTDIERRQLLMHELYRMKNQIQKQTNNYIDDKLGKVLLETISAIDTILDKTGKITDEQLMKVSQAQAGTMLQLIKAAFDRAKEVLAQEYPEVDAKIIEVAFNDALAQKAKEIEA